MRAPNHERPGSPGNVAGLEGRPSRAHTAQNGAKKTRGFKNSTPALSLALVSRGRAIPRTPTGPPAAENDRHIVDPTDP